MEFTRKIWSNQSKDGSIEQGAPPIDANNLNRIEEAIEGACSELNKNNNAHSEFLMIETGQYPGNEELTRTITFSKVKPEIVMIRGVGTTAGTVVNLVRGQTKAYAYITSNSTGDMSVVWGDYDVTISGSNVRNINDNAWVYVYIGIGTAKTE